MGAVYQYLCLELKLKIWSVAGYDFFYGGTVLYTYHYRYYYSQEEAAGRRKALQSTWLPGTPGFVYPDGNCFLRVADIV